MNLNDNIEILFNDLKYYKVKTALSQRWENEMDL